MKKLTVLLVLLIALGRLSIAQTNSIKGTVIDTAEKKNLSNAVIALIRQQDSVLVKFARSDKDGKFVMNNLTPGKFFIQITYPTYADFFDEVSLAAETPEKNIGNIMMTPKAALLEEVIVRQNLAIRIKGDTIEYKADSFKVGQGANVQEMLKIMPGFQVDRDGTITAHGKKVEKILVDGEEFFSDDPAVVTQNLRADAIDKVQAFDKKSDQAEFTGIDDGSRTKTVNLVLKEDKKTGYFGKLSAGGGTDSRYNGEAMLNYFKGKKKLSGYSILSNTGKVGLNWDDRDKFGGGDDFGDANVEIGAGFIMISGGGGDADFSDFGGPSYYGEGVPRSMKSGAHFSNKWNHDINHLNGNYSIKTMNNDYEGSSLTKYILPDSAYYFHENHKVNSYKMSQLFTGFYDIKLDSFSSIRFRLNGTTGESRDEVHTLSGSDDENLQAVNTNKRDNISNTDNRAVMGSVLWKQRLKKAGRTLSLSLSHKYSDANTNGFLMSVTDYFDTNGTNYDTDSLDQYKESFNKTLTTQSRLVYTEPLSKKVTLELNYAYSRIANTSNRKSFDKANNGKYESLNETFSSNYGLVFNSNSGGAKFQFNGKKLVANIGTNLGVSNYIQKDSAGSEVRHLQYTNLFPTSRVSYRFTSQRSLTFSYNGNPTPPSINQIQPVVENNDPTNIIVGNPNLKQAFNHNLSLFFSDFKILSGRSIWINGYTGINHNAIVMSQTVDNQGKRTTQYINVNGNYNLGYNLNYGFKIKKPEINIRLGVNGNNSQYSSFVNGVKSENKNYRTGFNVFVYKYQRDKYDISAEARLTRNRSVSSINTNEQLYWTYLYGFDMNFNITKKWQVGGNINFDIRQKTDAFTGNNDVTMWNMYLQKKFFKNNNGVLRFEAFDLLNQKKGFDRQFTSNYLKERTYEVLQQYFMLTFTWNFTKNPATSDAK